MKTRIKLALVLALALLAIGAASAHAQSINPAGPVSGVAEFPFFDYEGVPMVCDTGTIAGNADGSAVISDLVFEFFGNCEWGGVLPVEVACQGTATLIVQDAIENTGTLELNPDFRCDMTTDLCVLSWEGPQVTQDGNLRLTGEGSGDPKLELIADFQVTNHGSDICGPPSGTGSLSAVYDIEPTNLSFDP
jgi:hypothetical protein